MKTKLIYVTAANADEANRIAETVVTEHLAACANMLDGVTSLFRWDGKLCRENEAVLMLKTTQEQSGALMARIKELHSYECPCVVSLPIENGNPDFLKWIADSVETPESE